MLSCQRQYGRSSRTANGDDSDRSGVTDGVNGTGRGERIDDPTAPPTYIPVRRSGKPASHRLSGNLGKLEPATTVSYDDGVTLRVKLAARRTEHGSGPGAFPGRALTAIQITFTNKSRNTIDLTQVVLTTTYGLPPRIAPPVYADAGTADFSSWVKPGRTATAQYAFAIATSPRR